MLNDIGHASTFKKRPNTRLRCPIQHARHRHHQLSFKVPNKIVFAFIKQSLKKIIKVMRIMRRKHVLMPTNYTYIFVIKVCAMHTNAFAAFAHARNSHQSRMVRVYSAHFKHRVESHLMTLCIFQRQTTHLFSLICVIIFHKSFFFQLILCE